MTILGVNFAVDLFKRQDHILVDEARRQEHKSHQTAKYSEQVVPKRLLESHEVG